MLNIKMRKSIISDFEQIRGLLITCFGERKDNDFALFNEVVNGKFIVLTVDNNIVAQVMLQNTTLEQYVKGPVTLLSCACTHPDYRGHGFMRELFKKTMRTIPVNNALVTWAVKEPEQDAANLYKLLVDFKFEKQDGKEKIWTYDCCREAHGFKCNYIHSSHNDSCHCCDELWIKYPTIE